MAGSRATKSDLVRMVLVVVRLAPRRPLFSQQARLRAVQRMESRWSRGYGPP